MTKPLLGLGAVLLLFAVSSARGQSLGHYHLPSTVPQFCGLGCGAGYHAPMIRPTHCHVPRTARYVRMPGCQPCGVMPVYAFPGCYSPESHSQLDQLLDPGQHEHSPVTPTESIPAPGEL